MNTYIKKPVAIKAIEWTGKNLREVTLFTGQSIDTSTDIAASKWEEYQHLVAYSGLKIKTLEGEHLASIGDMIIKGVKGECYPCKPDIFKLTYFTEKEYAELSA